MCGAGGAGSGGGAGEVDGGGVFEEGFGESRRALRARATRGPVPMPAERSRSAASQPWTRQVFLCKSTFLCRHRSRLPGPRRHSFRRRQAAHLVVEPADLLNIILG